MRLAKVLIEHPVFKLDMPYTYYFEESLNVLKGVRVEVSFNAQKIVGYVLDIETLDISKKEYEERNGFELKEIENVIDSEPLLNEELDKICNFLAKEYVSPLISAYQAVLPPSLKPSTIKNTGKIKYQKYVKLVNKDILVKNEHLDLINYLDSKEDKGEFLASIPYSRSMISTLEKKGVLEIFNKEIYRDPFKEIFERSEDKVLTSEQKDCYNKVISYQSEVFLLEGVTGSGKTEVYINLARYYLNKGKNVLILVPEISLTVQMVRRIRSRLDFPCAIFHSALSNGEKYDEYRRVKRGEVRIVIGARSAIFAPLTNIGIIIIDEEHSDSYKQDSLPCYNAINVAKLRKDYHNCNLVLASATPSLESKARAEKGLYKSLFLRNRISLQGLPKVEIVNMLQELRENNYSLLSRSLVTNLKRVISNGEQAILLLNKRGFSKKVMCKNCGYVFRCPKCDITLTYHKNDETLKCHYCGLSISYEKKCPKCKSKFISLIGSGTQKVEELLKKELADARVVRMDLDTVKAKDSHKRILDDFENKKYDILIGTQIIAKGLDFENVTLAAVIDADIGLESDYRAQERTFDLLTQVVGRSGRGNKKGIGLIQTSHPDHFVIKSASCSDYETFYKEEMAYRRIRKYPPYRYLACILVSGKDLDKLSLCSENLKDMILSYQEKDLDVLGPASPFISKINNVYRLRLIVKFKNRTRGIEILNDVKEYVKQLRNIKVIIDVDPYSEG